MALIVLGVVIAVGAWRFVSPPDSASAPTSVRLAPASDFALGSVTGYRITSDGDVRQTLDSSGYLSVASLSRTRQRGNGLFYVVRLPNGDFRVLSAVSTHLGELVVWDTSGELWSDHDYVGVFVAFAHNEQWAIDGTRISGPAPRDLDRYRWVVDAGGVLVLDLSELVRGEVGSGLQPSAVALPPYDVTSDGWPTSGWPAAAGD
jgi:Rieske Fe-S protein